MVRPLLRSRWATRSALSRVGKVVITSWACRVSSQTQMNSGRKMPAASTSARSCSRRASRSANSASAYGAPQASSHQPVFVHGFSDACGLRLAGARKPIAGKPSVAACP
jgi:hypothetical protein